jgi:hypothetical protein
MNIRLTHWNESFGYCTIKFSIDGRVYEYETWDKFVLDGIREAAIYRPGQALNIAKNHCKLIDAQPKPQQVVVGGKEQMAFDFSKDNPVRELELAYATAMYDRPDF